MSQNVVLVTVDSLRADHLGCYGYHRDTSPVIDEIAAEGARFSEVYVSDAPCLPSRTALWSGRVGFHNGVVNHGGTAAQPFTQPDRGVTDVFHDTGWMAALRRAGLHTASVSSFAERHAAWHWYACFNEVYNTGKEGMDVADDVTPPALDWLERNGRRDSWFLHVNYWDPHIPYRTPLEYGNPFEEDPLPAYVNEESWRRSWEGYAPHSPQEPHGYGGETFFKGYPRFPEVIDSMDAVKTWIDGYDTGIRYTDDHVGRLIDALKQLGVYDETIVIVSADHGESQGEFNVWGDHQTADRSTSRVPLVIRWPRVLQGGAVHDELHYHLDWAATLVEGLGGSVPTNWDGSSFFGALQENRSHARPYLVLSQGAHVCQRSVRFDHDGHAWLCMWTYHDGYKMLRPVMLFDLTDDPHEEHDLAEKRPDLVAKAGKMLSEWTTKMMRTSTTNVDPMMTALREGPLHARLVDNGRAGSRRDRAPSRYRSGTARADITRSSSGGKLMEVPVPKQDGRSRNAVVVVGSANMDLVVRCEHFPRPGETILGSQFSMFPGGKGANQAVACARLGGEVLFLGKMGRDVFRDRLRESLQRDGVRLDYLLEDPDVATGTAIITVDGFGQNHIIVASGSNMRLTEADVFDAEGLFDRAGAVLLQLEIPVETVMAAARRGREAGAKVILNPAPAQDLPSELLAMVDLITPNETEAETLSGVRVVDEESAAAAARRLLEMGIGEVIVTMGSQGALHVTRDQRQSYPALEVTPVDTTAAGDAFNGALACAIASGGEPSDAIPRANAVAAFSVTREGAQPSLPTAAELEAFSRRDAPARAAGAGHGAKAR